MAEAKFANKHQKRDRDAERRIQAQRERDQRKRTAKQQKTTVPPEK